MCLVSFRSSSHPAEFIFCAIPLVAGSPFRRRFSSGPPPHMKFHFPRLTATETRIVFFIEIDFCCSPQRKKCSKNRRIIRCPIANCGSSDGRIRKHRCVTFGSLCTSQPNGTRSAPSPLHGKSTIASSEQLARSAGAQRSLTSSRPHRPRLLLLSRNSTSACHSSEERREFENAETMSLNCS